MTYLGTRPPTLDEWEKYEPHHRARMSFRPGLTGLWQVSGRSNITDFEEVVRPIAHILFAKDFYQAWVFVPFLLVSSMLNAASGYIGPILAAKKDSKSMAIAAFGGAGVNVVLNIALVYLMGIQGATIATVIASYIIYIIRKRATGDTWVPMAK